MKENEYGAALHRAYVARGWTQYRLADEVTAARGQKTSQALMSNISNGVARPSKQLDEVLRRMFPGALPVLRDLHDARVTVRPLGVTPTEDARRKRSESHLKRVALSLKPLPTAIAPVRVGPERLERVRKEIKAVDVARSYARSVADAAPRGKYGPNTRWTTYLGVLDQGLALGIARMGAS